MLIQAKLTMTPLLDISRRGPPPGLGFGRAKVGSLFRFASHPFPPPLSTAAWPAGGIKRALSTT